MREPGPSPSPSPPPPEPPSPPPLTDLYHGWSTDVPNCDTLNYTDTAPVDGGVYPYNEGDGYACHAWKLAATICNAPPIPYYPSANVIDGPGSVNYQCSSSGGFVHDTFGSFCAVSEQYVCTGCPGNCNANCAEGDIHLGPVLSRPLCQEGSCATFPADENAIPPHVGATAGELIRGLFEDVVEDAPGGTNPTGRQLRPLGGAGQGEVQASKVCAQL